MFRSESFIMSVVIRSLMLLLKVHVGVLCFHVGNATLKKLGVDLTQGGLATSVCRTLAHITSHFYNGVGLQLLCTQSSNILYSSLLQ